MSEEVLQHLFEPFFTTKPAGKGRARAVGGLRVVKQNGGHIEVDSIVGKGTTFRIYFRAPIADRPGAPTRRRANRARQQRARAARRGPAGRAARHAAHVDDERLPGEHGAERSGGPRAVATTTRRGGGRAQRRGDAGHERPGVAEAVRAEAPDVPFLFVSGYPDEVADARRLSERGHVLLRSRCTCRAARQAA